MDIIESHTAPSASDPGGIESSGFFQARRNSKSLTDIVCLPTLYDHLNREVERDSKAKKEVIQNKRIGFYRLRTQIGAGNFSKVKLGIHLLTNGRPISWDHVRRNTSKPSLKNQLHYDAGY